MGIEDQYISIDEIGIGRREQESESEAGLTLSLLKGTPVKKTIEQSSEAVTAR